MVQRRLIPSYIFLTIWSFISVFPLFWMITAATNNTVDISRGRIWFGTAAAENFQKLLAAQPLWKSMGNSFIYALAQTILCLLMMPSYYLIISKKEKKQENEPAAAT